MLGTKRFTTKQTSSSVPYAQTRRPISPPATAELRRPREYFFVLVLDSKRISRSAAGTAGNFEIGTGFHFGPPFQPIEHEDEQGSSAIATAL